MTKSGGAIFDTSDKKQKRGEIKMAEEKKKGLWAMYKGIPHLTKMLTALILGAIVGFVLGEKATVLQPLGTLFLNFLKMLTVPLVMCNLISGISSMDDPKMAGRVGGKILLYYMATTAFAVAVGLGVGTLVKPGVGVVLEGTYEGAVGKVPSIFDTIIGLIPTNIFDAMAKGQMDKIVVFSAMVGLVILFLPKEHKDHLSGTFTSLSRLFAKFIGAVMLYAPIGVFGLISSTVGKYGASLFGNLAKFVGSIYIGAAVMIVVYVILVVVLARMNPVRFIKNAFPTILTAFSSCSSLATIPVSMDCADRMGVPKAIHSFTIPLGAQINKDGTSIMLGVAFLFAAQAVGVPLSPDMLFRVILLGLIITTGGSSMPGGGLVVLAILMSAFDMPLEVVAMISGVFTFNEMAQTTCNCLGDLAGTVIVAYTGKEREMTVAGKAE